MSDVGPYGVTQNPDAEMVTADQLVGERAGNVTAHQTDPNYGPAAFSTAPYQPPKPPKQTNPLCLKEGCGNHHMRDSEYCRWHQP